MKSSEHFFFKLSDPRCVEFLQEWTQNGQHVQPEVANKVKEWFSVRTNPDGTTSEGLGDWDISRDAPYFGIEIPDAPGKYFYVWLDAPIGYLASLKNLLDKRGEDYDAYMADPQLEQIHFIGKDIVTFHTLFWPATLKFSGRKTPDKIRMMATSGCNLIPAPRGRSPRYFSHHRANNMSLRRSFTTHRLMAITLSWAVLTSIGNAAPPAETLKALKSTAAV